MKSRSMGGEVVGAGAAGAGAVADGGVAGGAGAEATALSVGLLEAGAGASAGVGAGRVIEAEALALAQLARFGASARGAWGATALGGAAGAAGARGAGTVGAAGMEGGRAGAADRAAVAAASFTAAAARVAVFATGTRAGAAASAGRVAWAAGSPAGGFEGPRESGVALATGLAAVGRVPYEDISKQPVADTTSRWLTHRDLPRSVRDAALSCRRGLARVRTASRLSAGRAAQEILDLVAIGARELELVPALEREEVLAVHVRAQALHQAQVDDGRAVHALKQPRIEDLLELLHGAAQDVRVARGVDAHVVAGGVNPLDRRHRHAHRLASLPDRQHLGVPPVDRLAAAREQLIERELAAAGDLRDDLEQAVALIGGGAGAHVLAHACECRGEARIVDRLQEVVHRTRLERLDGVLVVGGDEHHHRQRLLRQVRQHLETRHTGHLDVEEHEVRLVLLDGREGLAASRALRDDLEIGRVAQAQLDPAARQPLVLDDEGPDFHARAPRAAPAGTACGFAAACGPAAADSSGSAISIRSPGWRLSTAKRWFSP